MKRMLMRVVIAAVAALLPAVAEEYTYGPDSERQPGVPKGAVNQYTFSESRIFPGTTRDYWIYVPAQYKAGERAAVMVFQDGGGYVTESGHSRIPIVFDNLIHKREMPVTIAILINPGVMPALDAKTQQNRYNRSYEYDAVSDRYARFLVEELLPEVGKKYDLTTDPNMRGIAGSSSGGIAAFTAAWFRPDAFRRVLSFVGSYTNLRDGQIYASLVRKTEPKPLRVFLQDGAADQDIYSGSWFIANQDLAAALKFAGYDSKFVTGTEGHNMKQGGPLMPDALRWLWRDWQSPLKANRPQAGERRYSTQLPDATAEWEEVSRGHTYAEGPAVNAAGEVFFSDAPNDRIYKVGLDGKVAVWRSNAGGPNGLRVGPDGRLYACLSKRKQVVVYAADGAETVLADAASVNDIAVMANGRVYFTDPVGRRVWTIDPQGSKRVVHEGLLFPNGVTLSPDQALLMVADSNADRVWSFQIGPDGSLANGQPFYRLEEATEDFRPRPDGVSVDSNGLLYVATRLGVQICDAPGRVVAILNLPQPGVLSNLTFGGAGFDTLFVTAGDKVFKRKMRVQGVWAGKTVKPPQPRL